MKTDNQDARKARAKRLRKQVEEMLHGKEGPAKEAKEKGDLSRPPTKPKSPREFIHEKMRENSEE
jgi:hypothetical protein